MVIDRRIFLGGTATALIAGAFLYDRPSVAASAKGNFPYKMSDAEWLKKLGPERNRILRREGTERPYSSPLLNEKRKGVFHCAGCNQPLFSSATK